GGGVGMLAAAVSGAVPRAIEGMLTIMVGGEADLFAAVRPILDAMGANVIHVGPLGSGEVAKICNNLIAGVSMIAVAEAFTIGIRAGVDPRILHQVISKSSGSCWAIEHNCPVAGLVPKAAADQNFPPGFITDPMAQDLSLAPAAARGLAATRLPGGLPPQPYNPARPTPPRPPPLPRPPRLLLGHQAPDRRGRLGRRRSQTGLAESPNAVYPRRGSFGISLASHR